MYGHNAVHSITARIRNLTFRQRYSAVREKRQDETELTESNELLSTSPLQFDSGLSHSSENGGLQYHNEIPVTVNEEHQKVGGDEETAADSTSLHSTSPNHDWIKGVSLSAKASSLVLLLNLILIAIAAGLARKYSANRGFWDLAIFYRGSCSVAKGWNIGLHLVINIMSTGVLAASNYCMQAIVAPTREDVDEYHARHQWLDIGGASFKNLRVVGRKQVVLWTILLLTATPFHLLYNCIVFESSPRDGYGFVVGPKDLNSENVWNLTTPALEGCFTYSDPYANDTGFATLSWHDFASEISDGNYDRLTRDGCINYQNYLNLIAPKVMIVLAENLTVGDGGDESILSTNLAQSWAEKNLKDVYMPPIYNLSYVVATPFSNQSNGPQDYSMTCRGQSSANMYPFKECLAIRSNGVCQIYYSPPIAIVISLVLLVKVITMFFAAWISRSRSAPLLTVGDAVTSFLVDPDPTTEGLCWISYADIKRGVWRYPSSAKDQVVTGANNNNQNIAVAYSLLPRRKRWARVPSYLMWSITLLTFLSCLVAGVYFLIEISRYFFSYDDDDYGFTTKKYVSGTTSELHRWWNVFITGINPNFVDWIPYNWGSLPIGVVANTPQLFITASYYCYNRVLTSMLAGDEYSSYGVSRKSLRVTWPVKGSQQRSSYWLSVPYNYGVPVLVLYTILHWLVSQSFYHIRALPYWIGESPDSPNENDNISYSPLPIFVSILIGIVLIMVLIGLGFRRLKSEMPLVGTCSAAISAACHPPAGERGEIAVLGPVTWGETTGAPVLMIGHSDEVEDPKGHCTFTSWDTVRPSSTKLYA